MTEQPGRETNDHGIAAKFKAIMETAVGAIITINARGIIDSVNPAATSLFGYTSDELVGQNVAILMPEPDRSGHDGYIANYLATGERRIIGIGREVTARRKDGSEFPAHLAVSEFEHNGERRFAGMVHDLSTLQRTKSELDRQLALLRTIVTHIPDPLLLLDARFSIKLASPAVSQVFGYDLGELKGQQIGMLVADEAGREQLRLAKIEALARGKVGPVAIALRQKAGRQFPGEAVIARVTDGGDVQGGWIVLIRDVTREAAQEKALRHAQRMEALGQLTGGIAHDFNNLLTVITGNFELLDMRINEPEEQSLLSEAREAADMGARLTSRLLGFARRRQLAPTIFDINDHILGMLDLLRRMLGAPIDLAASLAPSIWPVMVDPSEFENAILNLAINSRDAMPKGGRLVIETRNVALEEDYAAFEQGLKPGDYTCVSISDTGEGMSPEVLQHAFEPFFTTKQAERGSGLGLSTVYGFVKQSGGHVTLYSELGHGTTINVYLPRATAASAGSDAAELRRQVPVGHGERVLVVEDNEQVRRLTSRRLEGLGYAVVEAASGVEAKQLIETGLTVDIVLSDVVMGGGVSGLDLRAWLADVRPGLPVLLTSGYSEQIATSRAGAPGPLAILQKPYAQHDLARAIRKALDRQQ